MATIPPPRTPTPTIYATTPAVGPVPSICLSASCRDADLPALARRAASRIVRKVAARRR